MSSRRRRCKRQLIKFTQHIARLITGTLNSDNEDEDQESTTEQYHRENLEQLQSQTHFTKQELQLLYRGFKNDCPSGVVNEDTFKNIYAVFFPMGGWVSLWCCNICVLLLLPGVKPASKYVVSSLWYDFSHNVMAFCYLRKTP